MKRRYPRRHPVGGHRCHRYRAGRPAVPAKETKRPEAAFPSRRDLAPGSVVLKKLAPDAPGAKRFANRYGDALVCVRYREDEAGRRRLTTIELVVDQRPMPPPQAQAVRIAYEEAELRRQVKAAGGIWDGKRKLWQLPKAAIRKLKLEDRVVPTNA